MAADQVSFSIRQDSYTGKIKAKALGRMCYIGSIACFAVSHPQLNHAFEPHHPGMGHYSSDFI